MTACSGDNSWESRGPQRAWLWKLPGPVCWVAGCALTSLCSRACNWQWCGAGSPCRLLPCHLGLLACSVLCPWQTLAESSSLSSQGSPSMVISKIEMEVNWKMSVVEWACPRAESSILVLDFSAVEAFRINCWSQEDTLHCWGALGALGWHWTMWPPFLGQNLPDLTVVPSAAPSPLWHGTSSLRGRVDWIWVCWAYSEFYWFPLSHFPSVVHDAAALACPAEQSGCGRSGRLHLKEMRPGRPFQACWSLHSLMNTTDGGA